MAFKPRFVLENGRLALKRNLISGEADFADLERWVGTLSPSTGSTRANSKISVPLSFVFSFLRAPAAQCEALWSNHPRCGDAGDGPADNRHR